MHSNMALILWVFWLRHCDQITISGLSAVQFTAPPPLRSRKNSRKRSLAGKYSLAAHSLHMLDLFLVLYGLEG